MATSIKGITIEIGGDTKQLTSALKGVNKDIRDTQGALRQVEKLLKLDPKNVELLTQKEKLLKEQIQETKDKLKTLKEVSDSGVLNPDEYDAVQREIVATEQSLNSLEDELKQMGATAEEEARSAGEAMKEFGDKMKKVGDKMQEVGKSLTTKLSAPLFALGLASIKLASDMEESMNKVEVAFGGSADKVKEFAESTLETYGISKGTALEMASLFGDMGTSMGLSESAAADMSMALVGLAGDLSSFKNISTDEAMTALNGIFTGETESLKRLGVVMTQANLDAFALANGYGKTTSEMTEAEKVQLRYAYVMNQTANAQGDFARTSDGAANQMRIAKESIEEAGASIGSVLLPYVAQILGKVNEWIQAFSQMDESTKKVIIVIALIAAAIGPLLVGIGSVISAVGTIAGVVGPLAGAVGGLAVPIAAVVAGIAVAVSAGILLYQNWDTVKEKASALKENLSNAWTNIKTKTVSTFNSLKSAIMNPINSAVSLVKSAVAKIKSAFNFSWSLPKPKLPHFTVTGGKAPWGFLGQGSLPKVSVSWYKTAMDSAKILSNPTIFGMSGGQLLGGGEAGREVVSGEAHLIDLIGGVVGAQMNPIYSMMASYFPTFAQGLQIDGNAVSNATYRYDSNNINRMNSLNSRLAGVRV